MVNKKGHESYFCVDSFTTSDHPSGRFLVQQRQGVVLFYLRLGSVHANTLQARRTASLLLAGLVALGIGTIGHRLSPGLTEPAVVFVRSTVPAVIDEFASAAPAQAVAEAVEEVQEMAAAALAPTPERFTRQVELGKGRTFSRMLTDADVSATEALDASAALTKIYDPRKLKAGQEFTLSVTRLGEETVLTGVTFAPEPTKEVSIARQVTGSYLAQLKNTPLQRRRVAARGEITGSLYGAGEREGVPQGIMAALIRAYSHEIDFQRDIHPGDSFEILYDQPSAQDGTPIGQGVIIYAALVVGGKTLPLYRVTFGDGAVDYFNEKGQSVRRSLLRTPVEGARMTSGYGMRRHPILGYSKMHKGVDFGAPIGTPIYAAGSGVVEQARYNGGYGKFILLRHNSETQTAYGHMSRFAKGIYPGARVNQGDVIGYVGNTGRSTGPHLHFEVRVRGQQMNPMKVSMPVGRVLKGQTLDQFKKGQAKIKQEYTRLLKVGGEETRKAEAPAPAPEPAAIKVAVRR